MADLDTRIEAHALQNALRYGQAQAKNVLPKILGEFPEQKARVKELMVEIQAMIDRVNALPPEDRQIRLESIAPDLLEKKQVKEKTLPPLPDAVEGKVVTRIPPEPSKYNHLGHAMSFIINAHYARIYHGKVILRFEDTNPEKESQEYVDAMIEDCVEYLGLAPDEIRYVSDDLAILESYATKLVEMGEAFMCFCPREQVGKYREECKECECRHNDAAHHLAEWKMFQEGAYLKGEGVLRLKGDMSSQNTVMRDPVLYRAIAAPHFRQGTKHKIWPLYDFYNPVEDALCGITHIMRSNEFELRVEVHERIKGLLGLANQHVLQYGRINVTGATTQGREIRALIESGEYLGWDDPRLVTLKALRRRGIRRQAYYDLVQGLGLSPYPVNLDFSMLAAANRKLVDPVASRYTFIHDPVRITVADAPSGEVEMHLHPDKRNGGRVFTVGTDFIVRRDDHLVSGTVRLKDHCTIALEGTNARFLGKEVSVAKGAKAISWLPDDEAQQVRVTVMMPDASIVEGVAERTLLQEPVDAVLQLERFGFCRVDSTSPDLVSLWYTHD